MSSQARSLNSGQVRSAQVKSSQVKTAQTQVEPVGTVQIDTTADPIAQRARPIAFPEVYQESEWRGGLAGAETKRRGVANPGPWEDAVRQG